MTAAGHNFVEEVTGGGQLTSALRPVLITNYTRSTLREPHSADPRSRPALHGR
jgi:hypothetical protein